MQYTAMTATLAVVLFQLCAPAGTATLTIMPIFSKKSERKSEGERQPLPTLPPPPELQKPRPLPTYPLPHRHELIFHCQLAHGSSTKEIKDFASVKDLYSRIAEVFEIGSDEVR